MILGVADWEIIVGQLLFSGEDIIQCLFNLLYYVIWWQNSEKHEIIAAAKASSNESEYKERLRHTFITRFCLVQTSFPGFSTTRPYRARERKRERERDLRDTGRRENLGTRLAQSLYNACPGLLGQCILVRYPRRTAGTLLDLVTRKA